MNAGRGLAVLLAGLLATGTLQAAADDARRGLLDQKLKLVERLLAGAGGSPQGDAAGQAQGLLGSARSYLESDRLDDAEQALDQALRMAGKAKRAAATDDGAHLRARYEELISGVQTFRHAYAEATIGSAEQHLDAAALNRLLDEAGRRHAAGDLASAVAAADDAYHLVARALAAARANETVEHRLIFNGPEEEYDYERERFESSEMLLRLMLGENPPSATRRAAIDEQVARARALDAEAANLAATERVEEAVKLQEDATGHLMRALREAGLYVPQ